MYEPSIIKGICMEKKTSNKTTSLSKYSSKFDRNKFKILHEEMSFAEYVDLLHKKPLLARTAFQYLWDTVISYGTEKFERYRKTYTKYKFFDESSIPDPVFGLEETLDFLMNCIKGAAGLYGTEKRVFLLRGPVGSSKSTICRRFKRGLEHYSQTDEGAWYTFKWVGLTEDMYTSPENACPMHEDPLHLMPREMREELLIEINQIHNNNVPAEKRDYTLSSEGNLCPRCQQFMDLFLVKYDGDWEQVVSNHIQVIRQTHSESRRMGIGTFQPKDEKNQDATELTGDINFAKIGHFGSDSDPRSFSFDGEFCCSNRGFFELIEMLKLHQEFLYDLLGASQEHNIKPKKFSQVPIDEVIIGHSNMPDYEKLQANEFMEALRDRTNKVDVPYLLRISDELKIYIEAYGPDKVCQHIMPHTLEIAAVFGVLSRLYDDSDSDLDLRDKAKLYDGKVLPNWTEDSVKELKDKYVDEGLKGGVSPRFIQDSIANCLARNPKYINVFHVLNEIKEKIQLSTSFSVEEKKKYDERLDLAIKELQDILKNEVQRALVADENLIVRVCAKYIDNVVAYVNSEKIINPITKKEEKPDERLMRSIEEKIDIPETRCGDYRRSMAAFIGSMATKKKEFTWKSNPELQRALEAKIFEDTRDTIKLSTLTAESAACDPDLQEKIEALKTRLIKQYGYNSESASDVLSYVASLFSAGV
jgi:serine protein kinase